jgi:hypothetical protein
MPVGIKKARLKLVEQSPGLSKQILDYAVYFNHKQPQEYTIKIFKLLIS